MTASQETLSFPSKLPKIRSANLAELDFLVQLEQLCFQTDQLTRRQWRYMLTQAHANTLISANETQVLGYILLLYNNANKIARIYSIAVANNVRHLGLGQQLVQAAEQIVLIQGRIRIRLEIRLDNVASINMFEKIGYKRFGYYNAYYADNMDAARYEKLLYVNK